ncbi:MAG: DUF1801 domain-containing protein [Acidobacteria bacterium]|nr:MAG: DUF1801 domain-containing protein [Acidobacteriota bacterium]
MRKAVSDSDKDKAGQAKDVDAYLATVHPTTRTVLDKLRRAIKAAAPQAEEVISYRIPTYKYHGPLVHFMAGKNHCSLIVVSEAVMNEYRKELEPYDTSGRTIHFSAENPLPEALVQKIVRTRIKENEAIAKRGKAPGSGST